ncbi:MAG TPA: tRNA (guanosine(37)-N1)-methyltransferase TrmD [Patescibacteria group bacterium]|nr:tRNA (guanosine(37)-N1)-methyltransferase TrmD [Patescibacteria group bacterium]
MKITILTLFPEMFVGPFDMSILDRAKEKNLLTIEMVNIRDFGEGKHKVVDDKPYGGGIGMVMKVAVLDKAIQSVRDKKLSHEEKVILLDPRGAVFTQKVAVGFSKLTHLILLCGHYEGVDERIRQLVDETISIGDFVVTGGEIPAMLVTDAVSRLITGVLKNEATAYESFSEKLLEYPQYTTPAIYRYMKVPQVLRSGNHNEIEKWRKEQAVIVTKRHRPDLLQSS